jgi:hypothetical protein
MARLDVSVVAATHGGAVGTMTSGLRPAPPTSVMLSGVVPSVNTDAVIVADPGSVEVVLLTEEVVSGSVGIGLQKPDMFDMPNEDVTGSGATEEGDEDVNPDAPVMLLEPTTVVVGMVVGVVVMVLAGVVVDAGVMVVVGVIGVVVMVVVMVVVALLVIPTVGHIAIAPRDVPGIGPKVPGLNSMAPNGLPAAPTVGIVPGTAVGDVMGVATPRRVFAGPTWATAVPQPIKTTANIVRNKRSIKTSWIAVERPLSISG